MVLHRLNSLSGGGWGGDDLHSGLSLVFWRREGSAPVRSEFPVVSVGASKHEGA